MATFDSKSIVDQLIAGNGRIDPEDAPDNPWVSRIVEYTNANGRICWGVVFEGERDQHRYEHETDFICEPRVIFVRGKRVN